MKSLAFILSMILSLLLGGGVDVGNVKVTDVDKAILLEREEGGVVDLPEWNQEICLASSQGNTFTGRRCPGYAGARTSSPGRRISSCKGSSLFHLKGGKLVDYRCLHAYLSECRSTLVGRYICERYLLAICTLRL